MAAIDLCHQQVVNALNKAGWSIDSAPYFVRASGIPLFADIRARQSNGQIEYIIVVEVKCFPDSRSDLDELYRAIGQYMIYRSALKERHISANLYLAIPILAYERIFRKQVVAETIRDNQIKLLLIDIEREEIDQWLE